MDKNKSEQQVRIEAEKDADPRVDLAVDRTELALERTQLAWVRTLLSLIAGGFIIDKGLEALHKTRITLGTAWFNGEHVAGILIPGLGTLIMTIVTVLYVRHAGRLAKLRNARFSFLAPGFLLSIVTILTGCLLIYFSALS